MGESNRDNRTQRTKIFAIVDHYEQRRVEGEVIDLNIVRQEYPELVDRLWPLLKDFCTGGESVLAETENIATKLPEGNAVELSQSERDPEFIGPYQVVELLGSGGYGNVYLCRDQAAAGREVAVKVPHRADAILHNEIRSVVKLSRHPGIVTIFHVDVSNPYPQYVVFEYMSGGSLRSRIERGNYDRKEAIRWCIGVARALNYAHKQRIVHRDMKPENILFDRYGEPIVTDFGMARVDGESTFNDSSAQIGTRRYMSPEQAGFHSDWATPRTDIYSLGVILYELICRRVPFESTNVFELMEEIKERDPEAPSFWDETIPRELDDICMKALRKDPTQRFNTAGDMAEQLENFLGDGEFSWRSLPTLWMAGVALLAIFAISLVWRGLTNSPGTPSQSDLATVRADGSIAGPLKPARPGERSSEASLPISSLEVHLQPKDQEGIFEILSVDSSADVPIRNGDKIQLHASLAKAQYVYLYWIASESAPHRLWPTDSGVEKPVSTVRSPQENNMWHTVKGGGGVEAAVMLTSDTQLEESQRTQIEDALPDTFQEGIDIGRVTLVTFPVRKENGSDRALGDTVQAAKGVLNPDLESTLQSLVTSYAVLLVPHK